jgi:signal peptidase I
MQNTLDINDRVLINKLVYDFRGIHRGDIVVFNGDGTWNPGPLPGNSNFFSDFASGFASMFGFGHASDIYVKRVIGLPGDRVACCDAQGRVTVNNVPLNEGSYLYPGDAPSQIRFSVTVPADHLWVMGDQRNVSEDSRYHLGSPGGGAIPESSVLGRAFVIIWPPSRWRFLPIPDTFQQPALNARPAAAAGLVGARLQPAGPGVPLALGLAAAVPVTWLFAFFRAKFSLRSSAGVPRRDSTPEGRRPPRRELARPPGDLGHERSRTGVPCECHDPSIPGPGGIPSSGSRPGFGRNPDCVSAPFRIHPTPGRGPGRL